MIAIAGLVGERTMEPRPALPPLTRPLRDILQSVVAYVDEHGYAPTMREIQATVGISSSSVVAYRLTVLEERGYLRRTPGASRSIVLLPAAYRVTR